MRTVELQEAAFHHDATLARYALNFHDRLFADEALCALELNACAQLLGAHLLRCYSSLTGRRPVAQGEPIPLALGSSACVWRRVADDALSEAQAPTRILFVSKNYTAIGTVTRAGLAATVLPQSMLGPELRPLGKDWALPRLPDSRMGLIRAPGAASEEAKALALDVRAALGESGRARAA